jgi:hypothetical protein
MDVAWLKTPPRSHITKIGQVVLDGGQYGYLFI